MRSVNQNHHLYVAKSVSSADVTEASDLGAIKAYICGDNVMDRDLYFKYKGNDGVVRSDLIPLNQITYVKFVAASTQTTKLKKVEVTLDSTINSGAPVVGQDYILNIAFQQFYGLSPEDTYVKTVAVRATSQMDTASKFYKAMVSALNAAFAREVGATAKSNPYLKFTIGTSGDPYEETSASFDGATATKLIIEEKEQPWSLGKWEVENLVFDVFCSTITVSGNETEWGTVANVTTSLTEVPNSKKMADLEWFTFAERGDFYRGMGYPNNFDFIPMVNPGDTNGYDALEIHYAYQGTCEDILKSEKDITIIASAATSSAIMTALTDQIEAIAGNNINGGASISKVATPVATPGAGSGLSGTVKVSLSCSTPGAKIYYSTSDSSPDATSTEFTGTEISLTSDTTIYAIAIKDGMVNSDVLTALYDFT